MAIALVPQSNDECLNQEFIRSVTPSKSPSGEFRFDYQGYYGCKSHCTLEIIGNLVIATEHKDNNGTSITNMAEHLATRVCYAYQIDPQKLIWIEHYPERGNEWMHQPIPESWDRVSFDRAEAPDGVMRFLHPDWKHLDRDTFEGLKKGESRE